MIITALAVAVAAVLGPPVIMATMKHWKEIVNWFKDMFTGLVHVFATVGKGIAHAMGAFIETVSNGIAELSNKLYYEEEGHYVEEVRVRHLSEDQLPAWAKKKLNVGQETDITDEVQQELRMTL